MKLFSFWRSSTSYRVRIAMNLKGVAHELVTVDLPAGEHRTPSYSALNPGMGVPILVLNDGTKLTQSMSILEYLEEAYPEPALLPTSPTERAQVRAAALAIACDIHPVNNMRVVNRIVGMGHDQDEVTGWMNHWMTEGLMAFDRMIQADCPYCFGDKPGLADICLIPQLYNAHRWGCDLTQFSRLTEIEMRCLGLRAFEAARPENQPDAI